VKLEGSAAQVAEEELEVLALRTMVETFAAEDDPDVITSDEMVRAFVRRDDGPWDEWWGKSVDAGKLQGPKNRLARVVKAFDIHPASTRIGEGRARAYARLDVYKADARYLQSADLHPSVPSVPTVTPLVRHVTDGTVGTVDVQVAESSPTQTMLERIHRETGAE
jgi:hypothetical protein